MFQWTKNRTAEWWGNQYALLVYNLDICYSPQTFLDGGPARALELQGQPKKIPSDKGWAYPNFGTLRLWSQPIRYTYRMYKEHSIWLFFHSQITIILSALNYPLGSFHGDTSGNHIYGKEGSTICCLLRNYLTPTRQWLDISLRVSHPSKY